MSEDIDFYTETMAKLYAKQGHLDKSAAIYRYLLTQEPGRQDFRDALAEIEAKLLTGVNKNETEIVLLMEQWIGLMLGESRVKRLRRIEKKLSGKGQGWQYETDDHGRPSRRQACKSSGG